MIDQEHGWESREIAGKATTITSCDLCGQPIDGRPSLADDKAAFGEPETTMLLCTDCRAIQARSEEPLPEPDEDMQP